MEINYKGTEIRNNINGEKISKEYDFFVADKSNAKNKSRGRRNSQKEEINTADIIQSELAYMENLTTESIVTILTHETDNEVVSSSKFEKNNKFLSMEERLTKENCSEYFDESGNLVFHSTSLYPKCRPQYMLRNDLLNVNYVPPKLMQSTKDSIMAMYDNPTFKMCLLDIKFINITFKHHHLFSLEHMLSETLKQNYVKYDHRQTINHLKKIEKDIKINRIARDKLVAELKKLNKSNHEIFLDSTVTKYNMNVAELKEKYLIEIKIDKELTKRILLLWKDIQKIRLDSGSVKTTVMLEVIKSELADDDLSKIKDEFHNDELLDILHNIENEHVKNIVEYKALKSEINKSSKIRITKPKLEINEIEIKGKIEKKFNKIVSKSKTSLKLYFDENAVTSDEYEISTVNYNFVVYLDDAIICDTKTFNINSDFYADISDSFSVQILPSNQKFKVSLFENETEISNNVINITDIGHHPFKMLTFNADIKVAPNKFSVGSGNTLSDVSKKLHIHLASADVIKEAYYTTADLKVSIEWSDPLTDLKSAEIKDYFNISMKIYKILNVNQPINFESLKEVINKVSESKDELEIFMNIYDKIQSIDGERVMNDEFVKSDGDADINNHRFKLLTYRDNERHSSLQNSVIPLFPSQISTDQMRCLNNDISSLDYYYIPNDNSSLEIESIDLKRYLGEKYMQMSNKYLQKNLHTSMFKKPYEDVVRDNYPINCRLLFRLNRKPELSTKNFANPIGSQHIRIYIFRAFCLPNRANTMDAGQFSQQDECFQVKDLRPLVRVSYKDISEQTQTDLGDNPAWNKAMNIKIRSGVPSVINFNIYDEVKEDVDRFESDVKENTVHYRVNHRWLGSLQVPLIAVQHFSKIQGALKLNTPPIILGYQSSNDQGISLQQSVNDPIQLLHKDEPFMTLEISMDSHQTLNSHSLQASGEEYTFRHLSDFIINYTKEFPSRIIHLAYFSTSGQRKCATQFVQAIPLPDLEILQKDIRNFPRKESSKSSSSKSDVKKSTGEERINSGNTTRSDDIESGDKDSTQNTFEMKSLRKDTNHLEGIINSCARYVSLIPMYESTQMYEIVLMGSELLKIVNGSAFDHTILLASYLLYLGVKCWIITGMGVPRGFSSYVLVMHDVTMNRLHLTTDSEIRYRNMTISRQINIIPFIYDATTGTKYDMRDPCSPLKTVFSVFNDENIWINTQIIDSSDSVSLDFTKTSDWQAVFNAKINLSKLPTLSEQNLYTEPLNVDLLKQKIENKIKEKVQKWRKNHRTIWNRYCSTVLKDSLPNWEYWSFNINTPKPGLSTRLKQLVSTYKIYGFPLNLPYTNMKRILSSIKSTAIFLNDDPTVEFGLAVEVFSYPSSVLSLWVYLASISRI